MTASKIPVHASIGVLGAGVIGASWAALFLSCGHRVRAYDPVPGAADRLKAFVQDAYGALAKIRPVVDGWQARLTVHESAAEAVEGAAFVQESIPERLALKYDLYRAIEPRLSPDAIVATSSSGLLLTDLQRGWQDCSRLILGHPFNPPHLIPLVELLANARTGAGVLDSAGVFYRSLGKVPIRVEKEVPGHVANRLQAALWREAIHLVMSGVASVADVDKAITAGPGLRWAVMGPHMLFNLGGGPGGMHDFCARYRDSFHTWWDALGAPRLTEEVCQRLIAGVAQETGERSMDELSGTRDAALIAILGGLRAADIGKT